MSDPADLAKQVADATKAMRRPSNGHEHRLDAAHRVPGHVHAGRLRAGRDRLHAAKNASHTMAMKSSSTPSASSPSGLSASRCRWGRGAAGDVRRRRGPRHEVAITSSARTSASSARRASSCRRDLRLGRRLFLFQLVFMDTAATIPTGAMAERWKFSAFCIYGCRHRRRSSTPSTPTGSGAAAGSRRSGTTSASGHGHVDFAGCSRGAHDRRRDGAGRGEDARAAHRQVHSGRHGQRRSPATTSRWSCTGTFMLAFGWFGFNPGSTLAGTDLRIAVVAVNTMLASAAGAVAA